MASSTTEKPRTKRKKAGTVFQMPFEAPPIASETTQTDTEALESLPLEPLTPTGIARASVEPFPPYPRPKSKGGNVPWEEGIAYWRGLPPEFIERSSFYVIREWPALDRLQELTPEELELIRLKQRREPFKNIDKRYQPFEETDTRMAFLRRYGSGDYKCYFNDIGVTGAKDPLLKSRNLFKFIVSFHDPDFPPILDPSRPDKGIGILDLTHPANQSYISDLRMKGVLLPDKKAGDDNVATGEVISSMANRIESLAGEVAKGQQDKIVERIDRIAEKVGNGNGASSMVEMLRAAKELVTPAPVVASTENAMLNTIVTLLTRQMETSQAEAKELREELREVRKVQTSPIAPKGILEQLSELASAGEALNKVKGLFGGATEAVAPAFRGKFAWLEAVREILPDAKDILLPVMTGVGEYIASKASPQTARAPIANGNGKAPVGDRFATLLKETITPSMLTHLNNGDSGEVFAAWLFDGFPVEFEKFQQFRHPLLPGLVGAPAIIEGYRRSAVWGSELAHREQQFQVFVQEFCAWKPEEDEDMPGEVLQAGSQESETEQI